MSLEATIAANTEAVRTLTELLTRLGVSALSPRGEPPEPEPVHAGPAAPAPKDPTPAAARAATPPKSTRAPSAQATTAPTPPTAEAAVDDAPAPKAEPSAQPPAYEEVKKALIRMTGTRGREAVVDLLARYGVASAKDLKPDVYASVIAEAA